MNRQGKNKQLLTALILGLGLALFSLWILGAELTPVARAVEFTVTKFADTDDGSCDSDCSLREAIITANSSGDSDTITLMAGSYTLTLSGPGEDASATGDLDITTPITITGAGPTQTIIDGGALDRVFHIHSGTVVISNVTIRNGNVMAGGGIRNQANLTLVNTIISNNVATDTFGLGGGIGNSSGATLMLINSTVSTNTATNGGGIFNTAGTVLLTNSIIRGNTAITSGGGIKNDNGGILKLTNSTISENTATMVDGGGIDNLGTALLTNSTISGNSAGRDGGGLDNFMESTIELTNSTVSGNSAQSGGGIANQGTTRLTNSTVSTNTATNEGGGFDNFMGTVLLTGSIISGNSAVVSGGGIKNDNRSILKLTNSTISENTATMVDGGGIDNLGTALLTNSTISGNSAGHDGGGVDNFTGSTVELTNSTVSGNSAQSGGGIANQGITRLTNSTISNNTAATNVGGGIKNFTITSTVELTNTIVASQTSGTDCDGNSVTSNGHNLASDGSCNLNASGDITNTDPGLGPLDNYGGETETHALLLGSPAIDAADNDACPATDQRGLTRLFDGDMNGIATCDIGAYEFGFIVYLPIILRNS